MSQLIECFPVGGGIHLCLVLSPSPSEKAHIVECLLCLQFCAEGMPLIYQELVISTCGSEVSALITWLACCCISRTTALVTVKWDKLSGKLLGGRAFCSLSRAFLPLWDFTFLMHSRLHRKVMQVVSSILDSWYPEVIDVISALLSTFESSQVVFNALFKIVYIFFSYTP